MSRKRYTPPPPAPFTPPVVPTHCDLCNAELQWCWTKIDGVVICTDCFVDRTEQVNSNTLQFKLPFPDGEMP